MLRQIFFHAASDFLIMFLICSVNIVIIRLFAVFHCDLCKVQYPEGYRYSLIQLKSLMNNGVMNDE